MKRGKDKGTTENWQYDAFISYRHTEPDSFVAQTLHKYLENFKLPRSVVHRKEEEQIQNLRADAAGSVGESASHANEAGDNDNVRMEIKTRIHRVFRDREELPLVSNLADPITEALEQSEYLIVICSPRLNESIWCRKEIETFIQMHDREHVLAVLVEGEPEDSFPEELLYREEEVLQDDGSVIYQKIPVEPLAADVRGTTRREIRKKIKSELLRLAAPMFDCNYDDLRQRHKEQRMRKTILTSVSVSAVCLLIGLVSTIMALKIQYQSRQIEEGAKLIYEQSEVIAAKNEEVTAKNREVLDRITVAQAREALAFLEEGDRLMGLAECVLAYENWLPENYSEGEEEKCPSQLTYALTELLYLYENGTQYRPDRVFEMQSVVRFTKLSPEGGRLMAVGDSGQLTVWECLEDDTLVSLRSEEMVLSYECEAGFLSENRILYPQGEALCVQDLDTKGIVTYPCDGYEGVVPIPEKEAFVMVDAKGCCLVGADGEAQEMLQWEQMGENWQIKGVSADFESAYAVTEDGRILVAMELTGGPLSAEPSEEGAREGKCIAVLEYGEDNVSGHGQARPTVSLYPVEYEFIGGLCLEEGSYQQGADILYVTSNHSEKTDDSVTAADMTGRLQAFDLSGQNQIWSYDVASGWLYDVMFAHKKDSSYLLCQKYGEVLLLDRKDGRQIDTFSFGSEVVKIGSYTDTENFMVFTRDGIWHYLHTGRMEDIVGTIFPDCTSANVKEFAVGDGYCVTLPYRSNCVTVYRIARGAGVDSFYEGENTYQQAKLNSDGSYLAAARRDETSNTCVEMFDTAGKKLLWTYEEKDAYYKTMLFGDFDGDGTESLLIVTGGACHIIDPADGTVRRTVSFADPFMDYLGIDRTNGVICVQDYHTLYGYRLADGALLYEDTVADGIVAVCNSRPFYAVASAETDGLLFYRMGEEEIFMDPRQSGIEAEYLETMFFDEDDNDLYLVYKDGSVKIYFVDWDTNNDVFFCDIHGRYRDLSDSMIRYEAVEGASFGFLCGTGDAYQIDLRPEYMYNKLSRIHGYLAYDAGSNTLYLHNGNEIYTSPLYSVWETVEQARQVLSESSYYWNYIEFVPRLLEEM